MEAVFFTAAIWLVISVIAAFIAYHLDVSIALVEICLGVAAAAVADHFFGKGSLGSGQQWLQFLAIPPALREIFLEHHAQILTAAWWRTQPPAPPETVPIPLVAKQAVPAG